MKPLSRCLAPLLLLTVASAGDWPEASGPNGNFIVEGEGPASFSVARDEGVRWRVPLPNTGQGTVVLRDGRAFVTSHAPTTEDTEFGSDLVGQCFDAKTGERLWERSLPGTRVTDLSSLFSDNTAASPVAHENGVIFMNVGGSIRAFDREGVPQWSHGWVPFGRHHARQNEPMLHDGKVIVLRVKPDDLDPNATTKEGAKPLGRDRAYWTWLQALDLQTGATRWWAESATSVHSTSILLGDRILTGRGGGHQPPEEPYGLSLLDATTGEAHWDQAIDGYACHQNTGFNETTGTAFVGKNHQTFSIETGEVLDTVSLVEGVQVRRHTADGYTTGTETLKFGKKAITHQSNLLVGDYHYFRAHGEFLIGRVHLPTRKVEYLEVPAQVIRRAGAVDETRWTDPLPNDMRNADGHLATQDKRNAGSGWGHVSAASPIVVGDRIYLPTMIGTVYVLKWDAPILDETALLSVSDLGPAGETWSLSSLAFANGHLYARTMKELICLDAK